MTPASPTTLFSRVLWVVLALMAAIVAAELGAILWLDAGHFLFSLDDPYIHLSLAENIWHGHYGVNAGEFAAPSSSILWPFLLAPFAALDPAPWLVLAFNVVLAVQALRVALQILRAGEKLAGSLSVTGQALLLVVFMLACNLVGLCFIGMEHVLQVLLALLLVAGVLEAADTGKVSPWLLVVIVLGPLVRYESLLLSAVAMAWLWLQGERRQPVVAGAVSLALLAAFSLFLLHLGLAYLPDSVLAKSVVAESGWRRIVANLAGNVAMPNTPKACVMLAMAIFLLASSRHIVLVVALRRLAGLTGAMLLVQLLLGRVGWFFRYEMAAWAFALPVFLRVWLSLLPVSGWAKAARALAGLVVTVAVLEGGVALVATPLAASNVYHQQFQLHRFVTEVYRQSVAVNDLGWTSYRNDAYVLDLWGLGSSEARRLRKAATGPQWMDDLMASRQVELAMIYHQPSWFAEVPGHWVKVAELDITGPKVTAWYPVSFYVRDPALAAPLRQQLSAFAMTLPAGTQMHILPASQ